MIGKLFMMKQNLTYQSGGYLQASYPPDIDKYIADYGLSCLWEPPGADPHAG
jgi:hypothetical protein